MTRDRSPTIVWFRQDLRVEDNPALFEASARGGPVIPVYIWAREEEGEWPLGGASRWWLHRSLASLHKDLVKLGSNLIFRQGESLPHLQRIAMDTHAGAVYWNSRYEPDAVVRDAWVEGKLRGWGIEVATFNANLLFEPWEIKTQKEDPYQVFTPFWKSCLSASHLIPDLLPVPKRLTPPKTWPPGQPLADLQLEPHFDWADGLRQTWDPGPSGAANRLEGFLVDRLGGYKDDRRRVDVAGTSMLSPHLHFGEIGPRQVWHAVQDACGRSKEKTAGMQSFLSELGWREFAHHLLYHFPQTSNEPLRKQFARFPWKKHRKQLEAWQKGRTGYPIVDAAMRHLRAAGWMPNRARMIVASFLTKDLMIPWQEGAKWFWDTLVDADLGNNTLGWQWTAGCGADAAPFFRIFNPVSQGEKFDPEGDYVRQWVPELRAVPDRWIHKPWEAPESGGLGYPSPIVDHKEARERALEAYESVRENAALRSPRRKET